MKKEEKIIPIDAPNLVEKVEATLWKGTDGRFYFQESSARYMSCTHDYCECGALKKMLYTRCEKCLVPFYAERFNSRPRKKLSELEPDDLIGSEAYDDCPLGNLDDIGYWLEDHNEDRDPEEETEITLADLKLAIYSPVYLSEIDPDRFSNLEDADEDFTLPADSPILKALDELNKAIADSKTIIGYMATNYVLDFEGSPE